VTDIKTAEVSEFIEASNRARSIFLSAYRIGDDVRARVNVSTSLIRAKIVGIGFFASDREADRLRGVAYCIEYMEDVPAPDDRDPTFAFRVGTTEFVPAQCVFPIDDTTPQIAEPMESL